MEIFVLTKEVNDYNQYGEYFVTAFGAKPSYEELVPHLGMNEINFEKYPAQEKFLNHILEGGGRESTEDEWYFLKKVEI